jgi:hypothetical protein
MNHAPRARVGSLPMWYGVRVNTFAKCLAAAKYLLNVLAAAKVLLNVLAVGKYLLNV